LPLRTLLKGELDIAHNLGGVIAVRIFRTVSGWSLIAIAGLVSLQAISPIFMFLGVPFIVAALVHVFLIAVLIESWLGRLPKMLAIIPLGAYAGYYAFYIYQVIIVAGKAAELRAQNSAQVLKFDPDLHSLISSNAEPLVQRYAIPVAYVINPNLPEGYLSYRLLRRNQCDAISEVPGRVNKTGVRFNDFLPQADVCELRFPEAPAKKQVIAVRHQEVWKDRWFGETLTEIVVDGKAVGSFTSATANQLVPFPLLMILCRVDKAGKLSLDHGCGARFGSHNVPIDTIPAGVDRTKFEMPESVMLGLVKYRVSDLAGFRGYPQNDGILSYLAGEPKRVAMRAEDNAFAVLKQLVDGGNPIMPPLLGSALVKSPERLEPLAEAMASRLVELIQAKPGGGRNRVEQMQTLLMALAALPPDSFARISGTLCPHLGRNPHPDITTTLCS
jgi:hypothetical protein